MYVPIKVAGSRFIIRIFLRVFRRRKFKKASAPGRDCERDPSRSFINVTNLFAGQLILKSDKK